MILRTTLAFRHSDLTGEITPALWTKGKPVVPTDYSAKIAFFQKYYDDLADIDKQKSSSKQKADSSASQQTAKGEKYCLPFFWDVLF